MATWINDIIIWLENLANRIPIELFALVGSFIEELVAPIPSPIIMTMAGSIAQTQGKVMAYLLVLAVMSSIAKTGAGWLLYFIADVAEDVFMTRFGKFFGVSHQEIERIGAYISGGWKDSVVLFLLRSIPVMPSSPISVTCGAIKINLRTFLAATFFGSIIRSFFFLYLGYTGLEASRNLMEGLDSLDTIFNIVFVLVLLGIFVWALYKRKRGDLPWQKDRQVVNNGSAQTSGMEKIEENNAVDDKTGSE